MTELQSLQAEQKARKEEEIKELKQLKSNLARVDFKAYIDYTFKGYIWTKWNRCLCRLLTRIDLGEISFLLLMVSPRWGKTELVAKQFPAYVLGRNEWKKNMVTSYSDILATESARHCLQGIKEKEYKEIFDIKLSDDKRESGNWETKGKGGYYSAGIGGSITGKGFDNGIIDDYVKNRADAESLTIRESVWGWYTSTFLTRDEKSIQKNTSKIVFATRWNVDDLGGRILEDAENKGKEIVYLDMEKSEDALMRDIDNIKYGQLVVFKVPALNEAGESNYPERFSKEQIEDQKEDVGVRDFEALYMQDPIKASGETFKKETFKYFALSDLKFEDFTIAIHIDPAWSTKKTSDDLAIAVTARHKIKKEIYQLEIFGEPILPSQGYSYIVNLAEKWKQYAAIEFISVEKVDLSKKQGEWITGFEKYLKDQGRFYTVLYHEPRGMGKKQDRIKHALEPMFNRGAIYFRSDDVGDRTLQKQEIQLLKFPVAPHDDLPDVLCQGVIMWDQRGGNDTEITEEAWDDFYST